ncbi:MAG: hypothetical protein IJ660_05835 [Alphaproteobacteria bacterium]|nr:hypothetical protein [Alphaproteobacteria bacterium]
MYKKPPIEYQFKKGQSGNPQGRPNVSDTALLEILKDFWDILIKAKQKDKSARKKLSAIRKILKN